MIFVLRFSSHVRQYRPVLLDVSGRNHFYSPTLLFVHCTFVRPVAFGFLISVIAFLAWIWCFLFFSFLFLRSEHKLRTNIYCIDECLFNRRYIEHKYTPTHT